MFERVEIGPPKSGRNTSGIVRHGDRVVTVQVPTCAETGQLVEGEIEAQARQVFAKLSDAMVAAGGSLADVMMVQVYIVDKADWPAMNRVWTEVFQDPYPARATVVVKDLMLDGMLLEIVAHAHLN